MTTFTMHVQAQVVTKTGPALNHHCLCACMLIKECFGAGRKCSTVHTHMDFHGSHLSDTSSHLQCTVHVHCTLRGHSNDILNSELHSFC